MPNVSPDAVAAWIALMSASRTLLERIEAALKAADLPPLAWYDALREIERAEPGGIRPFELRGRLLLPQYGASRLLDRIEKAGLLAREACAEDGRGQLIRITAAGRRTRRRMWPVYAGALGALVETRLDRADLRRLAELLTALRPPAAA